MPWYGVVIAMLAAAGAALAWLHFMQRGYPRLEEHEQDESQDSWREPAASGERAVQPERTSQGLSAVSDDAEERATPLMPSVHEAPTREFAVAMLYTTQELSVHTKPTLEFAVPPEEVDEEFVLLGSDDSSVSDVRLPTEASEVPTHSMSGLPAPSPLAWESTRPASGIQPQARMPVVSRVPLVTNHAPRTTSGYAMRGEELDSSVIEIRSDRKKNRSA